jgi:hypothetical protein
VTSWTAPSAGTWHFAKGEQPHPFDDCGTWCAGQGWLGWRAKGAVSDPDDDPNDDPSRFGAAGGTTD